MAAYIGSVLVDVCVCVRVYVCVDGCVGGWWVGMCVCVSHCSGVD